MGPWSIAPFRHFYLRRTLFIPGQVGWNVAWTKSSSKEEVMFLVQKVISKFKGTFVWRQDPAVTWFLDVELMNHEKQGGFTKDLFDFQQLHSRTGIHPI